MFSNSRLGCILLVTLVCTAAASAQQASPQAQAASGKIYLDVVVSPKSGTPVADLQQQDFTVLDNNSPQAITSFQSVSGRQAPVQVVLVIDAINTVPATSATNAFRSTSSSVPREVASHTPSLLRSPRIQASRLLRISRVQ